jgi:hypothetical protein
MTVAPYGSRTIVRSTHTFREFGNAVAKSEAAFADAGDIRVVMAKLLQER